MIWPISLLVTVAIICLATLIHDRMAHQAAEKAAHRETTENPCAIAHDFIIIDLKSIESAQFSCKHTCALYRCSRCKVHMTALFPGEWAIESFLKAESDAARDVNRLERMAQ